MKKQMIVIPSHDGSEYDMYVLPPNDNVSAAKAIVDQVIKQTKEELGEDIDGESGTLIMERLREQGFIDLEPVFASDNFD